MNVEDLMKLITLVKGTALAYKKGIQERTKGQAS
jgi:hypothetical protein